VFSQGVSVKLIIDHHQNDMRSVNKHDNQDTGKFRSNTKDQFYTNPRVAKACIERIIEHVPHADEYIWVEPSAGYGSFLNNVPGNIGKIGLDIEPRGDGIIEQDFLTWTPPADRDVIVFGNPPLEDSHRWPNHSYRRVAGLQKSLHLYSPGLL
jgi:hypothetical protein